MTWGKAWDYSTAHVMYIYMQRRVNDRNFEYYVDGGGGVGGMLYYCNCISFSRWWGKLTRMHRRGCNRALGLDCFQAYLAARAFFYSTLRGTIQNLQYHGGRGHSWQGIGMNARFFDKKKLFRQPGVFYMLRKVPERHMAYTDTQGSSMDSGFLLI
jgi:hypothetical protein